MIPLLSVFAPRSAEAAHIQLGSATTGPGGSFQVQATLTLGSGEVVSAVSLDIAFDAALFGSPAPSCVIDPSIAAGTAADKTLVHNVPAPGLLRVGVLGFNRTPIPAGPLFTCSFHAAASATADSFVLSSRASASSPGGTSAAVTGGHGTVVVTYDFDGDGILVHTGEGACEGGVTSDCVDNCPWIANADQADRGGFGLGSPPDGIGDTCQCGDVNGSGAVTLADAVILRRSLLRPPTATLLHPELCDVGGSKGCSLADAVILRRALLRPPTATLTPQCVPATP